MRFLEVLPMVFVMIAGPKIRSADHSRWRRSSHRLTGRGTARQESEAGATGVWRSCV